MVAGSGGASALRFLVVVAAASERGEDMVVAGKGGEGSKGRNTDVLWMANAQWLLALVLMERRGWTGK